MVETPAQRWALHISTSITRRFGAAEESVALKSIPTDTSSIG